MRIAGESFTYEKLLGEGTFGVVALYSNQATFEQIAIKFERPGATDQSLLTESLQLKKLKEYNLKAIPKYYAHGTIKGKRYLAM